MHQAGSVNCGNDSLQIDSKKNLELLTSWHSDAISINLQVLKHDLCSFILIANTNRIHDVISTIWISEGFCQNLKDIEKTLLFGSLGSEKITEVSKSNELWKFLFELLFSHFSIQEAAGRIPRF
jgi:hypothetical protein